MRGSLQKVLYAAAIGLTIGPEFAAAQWEIMVSPLNGSDGLTTIYFGTSVATVPDVNGDGVPEIVIGAPGDYVFGAPGFRRGRAHVFSGATRQLLYTLERPTPEGSELQGSFGNSVAAVPDLDGDGFGDIIVGNNQESYGGVSASGRAYVYSGATGQWLYALDPPSVVFACNFGCQVKGIGDLDGDGRGDFIVSACGLSFSCEYARVYSGATGAFIYQPVAPNSSNRLQGTFVIEDLDSDGVPDLALSMLEHDPAPPEVRGRVHLFSSPTGQYLGFVPAPVSTSWFGTTSTVGDLDGDGTRDLLISSPYVMLPGLPRDSGAAFIHSGATSEILSIISPPNPQDMGQFGYTSTPLPDVDGDGRLDFLVGAPPARLVGQPSGAGAAYVYSGATSMLLRTLVSPSPTSAGLFGWAPTVLPNPTPSRHATLLIAATGENVRRGRVYAIGLCRADTDADGLINSRDISRFLTGWVMTAGSPPGTLPPPGVHHGDFNDDGVVNPADISAFLAQWLETVSAGGCL